MSIAQPPETIYAKWEDSDTESDEHFLTADHDIKAITETGKKSVIGIYKLVRVVEAELKVSQRVIQKPVKK